MRSELRDHLRAEAAALTATGQLPGYLAGVYHRGEETIMAEGVAHLGTGMAMTETTGFLVGSITKVFTATLVFRCVERGLIDLDERVVSYLPELTLAPPARVADIRVKHLLNHTNGIDGDLYFPDQVKGRDALQHLVHELRRCSTLFDPGEFVSYSNCGMLVAGRLVEAVTGETYHRVLERELYGTVGMLDSSTSPEQAILRSTAIGHFVDPATRHARPTEMFMLPESWSSAGSTPISTIGDLLRFGRTHLSGGLAPNGTRVLSAELARAMRTVTVDMGTPNVSPIGLGWPFMPFGATTVLMHGGASPGGTATLMIVPDHDLAFAAFGNSGAAEILHDRLCLWILREYLGLEIPRIVSTTIDGGDLTRYEGTYRSNQLRVDVRAIDGQLEETMTHEPLDATQERIFRQFSGGQFPFPPYRLDPVGPDLFAPAGLPLDAFDGPNRRRLISFHGGANGRPELHCFGGRMARRVAP